MDTHKCGTSNEKSTLKMGQPHATEYGSYPPLPGLYELNGFKEDSNNSSQFHCFSIVSEVRCQKFWTLSPIRCHTKMIAKKDLEEFWVGNFALLQISHNFFLETDFNYQISIRQGTDVDTPFD